MAENKDKLTRFEEAVNMEISAEIDNILENAKKQAEEIVTAADSEYSENSSTKISDSTKQIKSKMEHLVSQESFSSEREVLAFRNKLVEDFFAEISGKVIEFSSSVKYEAFLEKLLNELNSEKAFYKGVTVFVKPSDEQKAMQAAKKFNVLEVKTDKMIKLGGVSVFYPNESQYIDKTLDDAFRLQKEKFVNNPEMQL